MIDNGRGYILRVMREKDFCNGYSFEISCTQKQVAVLSNKYIITFNRVDNTNKSLSRLMDILSKPIN